MPTSKRYDSKRDATMPWRAWYKSPRWKSRRSEQLRNSPWCAKCAQDRPPRMVPARVAHHVEPHRGDPVKFWRGKLESLCPNCHDSHAQHVEKHGYDSWVDSSGRPVDVSRHPFYR